MHIDNLINIGIVVEIDYTNWKGERRWRKIKPVPNSKKFASNEYHKEPQWLFVAMDLEKNVSREFAFKDVHEIRPFREKK